MSLILTLSSSDIRFSSEKTFKITNSKRRSVFHFLASASKLILMIHFFPKQPELEFPCVNSNRIGRGGITNVKLQDF